MADIFLSYAREDEDRVRLLAEGLESHGWSVWWDTSIPVGKSFSREIEIALADAGCIVVAWTAHSVKSDWVRAEASEGLSRGVLIPVLLDSCIPPLPFRAIQTADLTDLARGKPGRNFPKVVAAIQTILGQATAPRRGEARSVDKGSQRKSFLRKWREWQVRPEIVLLCSLLILALAAGWGLLPGGFPVLPPNHAPRQAEDSRKPAPPREKSLAEPHGNPVTQRSVDLSDRLLDKRDSVPETSPAASKGETVGDLVARMSANLSAYRIYLKDGSTILAKEKYTTIGDRALITLQNGTQTFIALSDIDIPRTGRENSAR